MKLSPLPLPPSKYAFWVPYDRFRIGLSVCLSKSPDSRGIGEWRKRQLGWRFFLVRARCKLLAEMNGRKFYSCKRICMDVFLLRVRRAYWAGNLRYRRTLHFQAFLLFGFVFQFVFQSVCKWYAGGRSCFYGEGGGGERNIAFVLRISNDICHLCNCIFIVFYTYFSKR